MARLWRRLRRNAGSVAAILARDAVRPANLLGLLGVAVGFGSLGRSAVALSGGQFVSTGVFGAAAAVALYAAGTSFLGNPLRGAAMLVAGLLLVGGVTHALGVGLAQATAADDSVSDYEAIDNPEVAAETPYSVAQDRVLGSGDGSGVAGGHGTPGGCDGSLAP